MTQSILFIVFNSLHFLIAIPQIEDDWLNKIVTNVINQPLRVFQPEVKFTLISLSL